MENAFGPRTDTVTGVWSPEAGTGASYNGYVFRTSRTDQNVTFTLQPADALGQLIVHRTRRAETGALLQENVAESERSTEPNLSLTLAPGAYRVYAAAPPGTRGGYTLRVEGHTAPLRPVRWYSNAAVGSVGHLGAMFGVAALFLIGMIVALAVDKPHRVVYRHTQTGQTFERTEGGGSRIFGCVAGFVAVLVLLGFVVNLAGQVVDTADRATSLVGIRGTAAFVVWTIVAALLTIGWVRSVRRLRSRFAKT